MKVRSIITDRFMRHNTLEVGIPDTGVVVVTGPNGSGKSTIVEAVAYACWGQTIRGTDPWQAGQPGVVQVLVDDLRVRRSQSKLGRRTTVKDLEWSNAGEDAPPFDFESNTHAQAALEQHIGDFDLWRQSHVISSTDAARFTTATDAKRKQLLEAVLGLDRFERAATKASDARKTAERAHVTADRAHAAAQARAEALGEAPGVVGPEPDLAPFQRHRDTTASDLALFEEDHASASTSVRNAERMVDRASSALDAVKSGATGVCPTCGQDVSHKVAATITARRSRASDALFTANVELATATRIRDTIAQETRKAAKDYTKAQEAFSHARHAHAVWEAATEARGKLIAAQEDASRCAEILAGASTAVEEARAVQDVLGPRGVRAHILGSALAGIEATANAWLCRLGLNGLQVHLRAQSELASGATRDVISLEVDGAGGGHGYRGASGGERRRLDIALTLALAEVTAAAQGRHLGTLFFDEVFDALDSDGVDAVVACVRELAMVRAVVVISHSEDLVARLRPDLRITF